MKKIIVAIVLLAVAGSQVQTAKAGDREWAVVGKVLTGIAAADIIGHAISGPVVVHSEYCAPAPVYSAPPPACYAPAVVYRPAPVCYTLAPGVVYSRPVVYAPAPVVRVGFGYAHRPHPIHGGRW